MTARVKVNQPTCAAATWGHPDLRHPIPLEIELIVDPADRPRASRWDGDIALRATARPPSRCCWSSTSLPRPSDIAVHVTSKSVRGEIPRIIGGIDTEIRRFIAAHVAEEVDSPASPAGQEIDVAEAVSSAWTRDPPGCGSSPFTADLRRVVLGAHHR